MDRVMTFRLIAASVVVVVLAAACGIQASAPTPTPTPTPRPPAGGIHTPEDVRAQYEGWPEGYKLALDEDVVVMFSYPSPITDWTGFAFINHIPSVSSVTLKRPAWVVGPGGTKTPMYLGRTKWYDGQEVVLRTHYGSEEGEKQLEAVLADEQLMLRILGGPPATAPTPTPTLTATPAPDGMLPYKIRVEPVSGPVGTTVTITGRARPRAKLRVILSKSLNLDYLAPHAVIAEVQVGPGDLMGDFSVSSIIPPKLDEMGTVGVGPGEYYLYAKQRTEDRPLGGGFGTAVLTVTDGGGSTPAPTATPTPIPITWLPISSTFPSLSEAQKVVPFEIARPKLQEAELETVWVHALADWSTARIEQVYKMGEDRLTLVQARTDRPWSLPPGDRELTSGNGTHIQLTTGQIYTSAKWVKGDVHFELLMEKGVLSDERITQILP